MERQISVFFCKASLEIVVKAPDAVHVLEQDNFGHMSSHQQTGFPEPYRDEHRMVHIRDHPPDYGLMIERLI